MKNILACFDFSEVSSPILETAATLSTAFSAKLYLLHVLVFSQSGVGFETIPIINPDPAKAMHEARDRINTLREPLLAHGLDTSTVLVDTCDDTVDEILDEAERLHADLIIMGSHGHGKLYNVLGGSTASGVLRRAKCPVLLVPARNSVKVAEQPTYGAERFLRSRD